MRFGYSHPTTKMDLEKVKCLVCLSPVVGKVYHSLNSSFPGFFSTETSVLGILQIVSNKKIILDDKEWPTKICTACLKGLKDTYKFIVRLNTSFAHLRSKSKELIVRLEDLDRQCIEIDYGHEPQIILDSATSCDTEKDPLSIKSLDDKSKPAPSNKISQDTSEYTLENEPEFNDLLVPLYSEPVSPPEMKMYPSRYPSRKRKPKKAKTTTSRRRARKTKASVPVNDEPKPKKSKANIPVEVAEELQEPTTVELEHNYTRFPDCPPEAFELEDDEELSVPNTPEKYHPTEIEHIIIKSEFLSDMFDENYLSGGMENTDIETIMVSPPAKTESSKQNKSRKKSTASPLIKSVPLKQNVSTAVKSVSSKQIEPTILSSPVKSASKQKKLTVLPLVKSVSSKLNEHAASLLVESVTSKQSEPIESAPVKSVPSEQKKPTVKSVSSKRNEHARSPIVKSVSSKQSAPPVSVPAKILSSKQKTPTASAAAKSETSKQSEPTVSLPVASSEKNEPTVSSPVKSVSSKQTEPVVLAPVEYLALKPNELIVSSKQNKPTESLPVETVSSKQNKPILSVLVESLSLKQNKLTVTPPVKSVSSKLNKPTLSASVESVLLKQNKPTATSSVKSLSSKKNKSTLSASVESALTKQNETIVSPPIESVSSKQNEPTESLVKSLSSKQNKSIVSPPFESVSLKRNNSTESIESSSMIESVQQNELTVSPPSKFLSSEPTESAEKAGRVIMMSIDDVLKTRRRRKKQGFTAAKTPAVSRPRKILNRQRSKKLAEKVIESGDGHKCDYCTKEFGTSKGVTIHMKYAHNEEYLSTKLKCVNCDLSFRTKSAWTYHRNKFHPIHPESPNKCDLCNKEFSTPHGLNEHHTRVHIDMPARFMCNECGKFFKYDSSLQYHLASVHKQGERNHLCKYCGYKAITMAMLKNHEIIHSEERPYKCKLCPNTYKRTTELLYHNMKIHERKSLHNCKFCGKGFIKMYNMRIHWMQHEGNHKCAICPKGFRDVDILDFHYKYNHKDVDIEMELGTGGIDDSAANLEAENIEEEVYECEEWVVDSNVFDEDESLLDEDDTLLDEDETLFEYY